MYQRRLQLGKTLNSANIAATKIKISQYSGKYLAWSANQQDAVFHSPVVQIKNLYRTEIDDQISKEDARSSNDTMHIQQLPANHAYYKQLGEDFQTQSQQLCQLLDAGAEHLLRLVYQQSAGTVAANDTGLQVFIQNAQKNYYSKNGEDYITLSRKAYKYDSKTLDPMKFLTRNDTTFTDAPLPESIARGSIVQAVFKYVPPSSIKNAYRHF